MTSEEFRIYWLPAYFNLKEIGCLQEADRDTGAFGANGTAMDKLLGVTQWEAFGDVLQDNMPDDLKKLLSMLAGPHGKTILKAYRIRRGLE